MCLLFIERAARRKFPKVVFWSDSVPVLHQIFDMTTCFKKYFANRLSKIHAGSRPEQWRHVDSNSNPADHASKGIQAHETDKWKTFHEGPEFLKLGEACWPKMTVSQSPSLPPPIAQVYALATEGRNAAPAPRGDAVARWADKWSGWNRKLRLLAVVKKAAERWKSAAKQHVKPDIYPISVDDLGEAENLLWRAVQERHFSAEKANLASAGANNPNGRGELRV